MPQRLPSPTPPLNLNPLPPLLNPLSLPIHRKDRTFQPSNRARPLLNHCSSPTFSLSAMELEDDLFYADLRKQIALLVAEDEEGDLPGKDFPARCLPAPVQGYPYFPQIMIPPITAFDYACRRESRGTGVFIPKSSIPRRKLKPVRHASTTAACQAKQIGRTAPPVSEISATANVCDCTNYSKSGGIKKLNTSNEY